MNRLLLQLRHYAWLMRLNRPVGIFLLLWPTLWALWIAGRGHPSLNLVVVFIVGVILMRSAGCVINDYFDRKFDHAVVRTHSRPLVTGKVSPREALILFAVCCLLAASLLLVLPPLARWLALPAVIITVLYPCMKRYTHLPQLVLGVAFSWGVLMVFAAQTEHLSLTSWFLFVIACIWPIAYDTIYAMVDRRDDLRIGVKSTAILWGDKDIFVVAGLHLLMLITLALLGIYVSLGSYYFLGLLAAAIIMGYEQYLIKDRETNRCFKAFLISHWAGCAIFIGIWGDYLYA